MKTGKKAYLGALAGSLMCAIPMLAAAENYDWYYSLDPYTASNQIPELAHYYVPDAAPDQGYAYPKYSGKWHWRKAADRHLQTRQTVPVQIPASVYIPEVQAQSSVIPTVEPVADAVSGYAPERAAITPVVRIPWRSRSDVRAVAVDQGQALPWNDLSSR